MKSEKESDGSCAAIREIIKNLTDANIELIECGYLGNKSYSGNSSQFCDIEQIGTFLPENRGDTLYLAMADVMQVAPEKITEYTGKSIDGIRVVFYKHQMKEAFRLCSKVKEKGYKLFVQPMVSSDYTAQEYTKLSKEIAKFEPFSVSIVDSFGYMTKQDFQRYFMILDCILSSEVCIGFHTHNNMEMAFSNAQSILDYKTKRSLIIDSSLGGMGRGAGNLNTELITNYYNAFYEKRYDMELIMDSLDRYIMPVRQQKSWGYSPYLFLTGVYRCHPNFACYLLEKHSISIQDFRKYLESIPEEMKSKCRKPYVEELYQNLMSAKVV